MSRFLFVMPPVVGHLNPALGVADELLRRGHQVAWAGIGPWLRHRLGPDATVYDCAHEDAAGWTARPADLRGPAALKYLWNDCLVPLAEAMVPGTADAVRQFHPNVIVADQQALAGALVAERLGIPLAISATTSAELVEPFAPKVEARIRAHLDELRDRFGDPTATTDPRFSPDLVLAYTTEALVRQALRPLPSLRFVGPVITGRGEDDWAPPWPDRQGVPTVLITLGTVNVDVGERFLTACADAVTTRRGTVRAIILDPAGHLGAQPNWISVHPHIPQLTALRHVDLVLCHAAHNSVCEALWHGIPLVVAPIRDDQQIIAEQVVAAGAGRRLRFGRATPEHIGSAIDAVLADKSYTDAAQSVRTSFHAAGGAHAAANHLETLTTS